MAKKTKTYQVSALLKYWGSIDIEAGSLAEAVEASKTLVVTDFVNPEGEHNDSNIKITGVSDNDWNTDL